MKNNHTEVLDQGHLLLLSTFASFFLSSFLFNSLDDTDSNSLFHISDGETAKRWVLLESFNAHWLRWEQLNHTGITSLDELWVVLKGFTSSSINLGEKGFKLASSVGGMAIKNWRVSGSDLVRMIEDDDLGVESLGLEGGVVLFIRAHETSLDVLDGDVSDGETDIVSWTGLYELLVMHFHGLAFRSELAWGESHDHAWLEDTSLDTSDWNGTDTGDLEDIVDWESEWLVMWSLWGNHSVKSLHEGVAAVPWHLGLLNLHVLTSQTGEWNERNVVDLVTGLLQESGSFLLDLFESFLTPVGRRMIHLVDTDDHLLDTEGEGKHSVLLGLTFLGDTGFEFTGLGRDHQNGDISLGGTGNHVLDEISVAWGIDDGVVMLFRLERSQGNVDGDTSISLGLKLVQNPSESE